MLTKRQKAILEFVQANEQVTAAELIKGLAGKFDRLSKPTILRELEILLSIGQIEKRGKARSVTYSSKIKTPLLRYVNAADYFAVPVDERKIKYRFDWEIFDHLSGLFNKEELKDLEKRNKAYQQKTDKMAVDVAQKELERLLIELSWKSSELEGNTYSLLDTEVLLKEMKEAKGHTKAEATMILNHKYALDFVLKNKNKFKKPTAALIRALHSLLIKDLGVTDDYRKIVVGIVGTNYKPIDNQFQIKEAMEKMISAVNTEEQPIIKAIIAAAMISYIQPFVDGNKRTGRILGNAILLAHDWCPLSFRSVDSAEYKKALLLFYEQNSLRYFKELFVQQFEFAVKNYFG
ncbi:cell filamentation protein Fic [Patescibacteria group bacterium]|nr:MAG: cell filamentation protein Fic [Patescibacteria group bacterium]